jgi:hypothetical protein
MDIGHGDPGQHQAAGLSVGRGVHRRTPFVHLLFTYGTRCLAPTATAGAAPLGSRFAGLPGSETTVPARIRAGTCQGADAARTLVVVPTRPDPALVERIVASTGLTPAEAARVVEDVVAFHAEPVEDYVRRRHAHLKTYGARNEQIFAQIAEELAGRVVAAPQLTERQLRRMIYG